MKVKCGVHVRWTRSNEKRMRRLGSRDQKPENGLCVAHIGHRKSKVHGYVVETSLTISRTRLDQVIVKCHEHLVDYQTEDKELGHSSISISHAW